MTPSPPASAMLARIEEYVGRELRKARIPGGAVAVMCGDEPLLLKGIGQTGLSSDSKPVTPDTLFQIGSLTKGFTAMAVLQLRDRGLIDLAAPVQRYLPWFRVADPAASARMTVQHLIDQTSGLPNGAWKVGLDNPSLRVAVERLKMVKLLSPPGEKWSVAFDPLGRQGREWARPHVLQLGRMSEIAVTDDPWAVPGGLGPACSVTDLARWAACHLGDGTGRVLSAASLAESHAGAADPGIAGGHYGRGWFNMTFCGSRLVFNHGGTAGYSSVICMLPDENLAVAALLNCSAGIAMKLGLNVVRILKGQAPDVPDVFPDFGRVFSAVIATLGVLGALLLGGLAAGAALGWRLPAWLGWALGVVADLCWALPGGLKRNYMMPLPFPMNVGPAGWPLNLVLVWWAFLVGLSGWALYGILL
ncbi:MAG TPA: serine hydrolase domain-containing protein [Symbiobacteriaceae bacterium]|nr:serine hydrolase domain-containing protein [Symbiobacteriaceae bacterium]